jgi:hypothetical protein
LDVGHTDVLHQLCKVMISERKSSRLVAFVTNTTGAEDLPLQHGGRTFESWPVDHRAHIVQLAAWLLSRPQERIAAAWQAKAVRYNWLVKDFSTQPRWYRSIIEPFNRR